MAKLPATTEVASRDSKSKNRGAASAPVHARAVGHEPGLIELPHGGINDRKPGLARAPQLKILPLTRPIHSAKFGVEFHVEHLRKMPQNAKIKLTPDKFARNGSPDDVKSSSRSWIETSLHPTISSPVSLPRAANSTSIRRPNGSGSRLKNTAWARVF